MDRWERNLDGEYGEHSTILSMSGRKLTIYSDRNGEEWACYLDNGADDFWELEARGLEDAKKEALEWAGDPDPS